MTRFRNITTLSCLAAFQLRSFALVLALICGIPLFAFALKNGQLIVVTNHTAFNRKVEIIAINRNLLREEKNRVVQIKKGGRVLISQTTDRNNDGYWDELLIEINLPAYAKDTLKIEWVDAKNAVVFPAFTGVRLSLRSDTPTPSPEIKKEVRFRGFTQNITRPYYQMEGPGIENDKVAFRTFFDRRNGKDIYGKTADTPILERVGLGASWHELQPWGMDIFHTGTSLGAGGLAVADKGEIYRLGDADTSTFEVLYKGSLAASFRLGFTGWDAGRSKRDGSESISMTKGTFYYKNEILLTVNKGEALVAGIANFSSDKAIYKKQNTRFSSVSIYGPQAEGTNTRLGIAILFPSDDYVRHKTTDSLSVIPNTSYVELKPSPRQKMTLYFFACWEKTDSRFSTEQGFDNYLQETAQALAAPVQIKIINQKSL